MFRNYLQVALRNLARNRLYSAINILGLATGLAACLMLLLYVVDELSFDTRWEDSDRIYRLETVYDVPDRGREHLSAAAGPHQHHFRDFFADKVEVSTRFFNTWPIIHVGDEKFEESIYMTDPGFLDLFQLDVLAGNLEKSLSDANSVALSRDLAIKYFGTIDAVGRVVTIDNWNLKVDYRVGAVYENLPHDTTLAFNALVRIVEENFKDNNGWMFDQWFSVNNLFYFKLKEGTDVGELAPLMQTYVDERVVVPPGFGDMFEKPSEVLSLEMKALTDIQLTGESGFIGKTTNSVTMISIFSAIALMILIIACINFMNLSLARATRRAREVALRKVLGAGRKQLISQFLGEAVLMSLAALFAAVVMIELMLPLYNEFLGRTLVLDYTSMTTLLAVPALVLVIGLAGGFYPAFVLSGFRPAMTLRSNRSGETSGSLTLRNTLVIFQFAVSIALIVATVAVFAQREFLANMDVGYDKDKLIVVHGVGRDAARQQSEMIKHEINALPEVHSAAYTFWLPAESGMSNTFVRVPDVSGDEQILVDQMAIDDTYFETYGVELLAGRPYDRDRQSDHMPSDADFAETDVPFQRNVIINHAAVSHFGFGSSPEDALGKVIRMGEGRYVDLTVIGVMDNISMSSTVDANVAKLHPMMPDWGGFLVVRFNGGGREALDAIETWWRGNVPDLPFVYSVVSERLAGELADEERLASMMAVASVLAIFVSCLGLFGLASFSAERRTQEIGIRKVMGADMKDILRLLVWQFSRPVLIASLIAWPLASWGVITWLEQFPFRIDTMWLIPLCLAAAAIALAIAWGTIGTNAFRVARANPVHALRQE